MIEKVAIMIEQKRITLVCLSIILYFIDNFFQIYPERCTCH